MSAFIIFDLDGTLIDSEFNIARITADLAQAENCNLSAREAFCTFGGMSFKDRFNTIAKTFDREFTPEKLLELHKSYQASKEAMYADPDIAMIKGARSLVERLSQQPSSFTLGLASSNACDRSRRVLANAGLSSYFGERVYGSDLVGGRKKPDPAIYHAALTGHAPEKVLVVEDSLPGVMAAHAAGAFVVAYVDPRGTGCSQRKREYRDAGADIVICDYNNFEALVQRHWKYWPASAIPKVALG